MTGSVTGPAAAKQIAAVLRPSRQDDQRNRSAWALPCQRENASLNDGHRQGRAAAAAGIACRLGEQEGALPCQAYVG